MSTELRVLMVTSEWPTPDHPERVPFIVRQAAFLQREGVHVDVFPFRGAKDPGNYLRAWRQLRKQLGRDRYDLIHAQFGQSGLLALPKRMPLVVTFRGSDVEGIVGRDGRYTFHGRVLCALSRWIMNVADEVIAVSESLTRHLPRRHWHVIPAGLDLQLFRPAPQSEARRRLGLPSDRKLVLFAADPKNARKRYGLAQAAVAELTGEPEVELVVASGVPYESIPHYMNACDALILTSLHEGSPNVVKEALACNLPVVSTDVGDVRTRLASLDGCAVVEDTPQKLADALRIALSRRDAVARRAAVASLDEEILTRQVIEVYYRALAGWRRAGTRCSRPA
jgi:teichuronic acid biosynthesis glycosyltransferase TuaC